MKILHYCQHILGMGHFFRSLEIAKALSDHDVYLVTGGPEIEVSLPSHIRQVRMPGLMMDAEFENLLVTDKDRTVEDVKSERIKILQGLFQEVEPDLFLIELYPFGRNAFRFELKPILEGIADRTLPPSRVVCSLRDVLVEKEYQEAYEERVLKMLNGYFDALLVHSDPALIKLDNTFSRIADIEKPVLYTGFVTRKPIPEKVSDLRRNIGLNNNGRLVVASAGGGKVGFQLLEAAAAAVRMHQNGNVHLQIFSGPFMEDHEFGALKAMESESISVDRFTGNFLSWLAAADLSISMAGYNTCMNILAASTPALVWPFAQNREQRLRADTFAELGAMKVLDNGDLEPAALSRIIENSLYSEWNVTTRVNLDGAAETNRLLKELTEAV